MKFKQAKHLRDFKHPIITRRDLLTHGLLAFGAVATIPSLAGHLIPGRKKPRVTSALSIPFLAFDMAGGGSMHGNFLAGKAGGPQDLLAAYDTLGWDPRESGALNTAFGLPMSAKYSKILAGILQGASANAQANLRMGSLCHNVVQFDSQTNNLNATVLVLESGVHGTYIPTGGGVVDSLSGGNSSAVQQGNSFKPVVVNGINDILGAVSFGGTATSGLTLSQMQAMAQGGADLSNAQIGQYLNSPNGYPLSLAAPPAYAAPVQLVAGVQGLDPRLDTYAQAIYGISATTDPTDPTAVVAGLVMNTIQGNCGPSTWTLANCDYHTGDSADGDGQDLKMGLQIGWAVEYAYRQQKPLFFQLITDGSCSAQGGSRNWDADSFANMTIIGYYNPTAPPSYVMDGNQPRQQIGNFTDAQTPDTSTLIGASPDLVTYAVFANYLNLCGQLGNFSNLAPSIFNSAQLNSVLVFEGTT